MATIDYEAVPAVERDDVQPRSGTVVMKFGGTSVADLERIGAVLERVADPQAAPVGEPDLDEPDLLEGARAAPAPLEFRRRNVAQRGVPSLGIVVTDVFDDRLPRLLASLEVHVVHALDLQPGDEFGGVASAPADSALSMPRRQSELLSAPACCSLSET